MNPFCVTMQDIEALLDNELSKEDERRVCLFIQANHGVRDYYDILLQQKHLLRAWWDSEQDPSIKDNL